MTTPFLRTLERAAALFELLSRLDRGRPPVTPVDRTLRLVVRRADVVAADVLALTLAAADGTALPPWHPGCHLDLVLASGRVRQYSLCGDPADRWRYRIAVRRVPGGAGGSAEVHETLRAGSRVDARGPRNAFPFIPAPAYLFVAGGIGITPILPMVRAAARAGVDWRLVYCGRSRESMPFLDELDGDRVWVRPDTEYGIPASGAELLERAPRGARVYCCGPPPMVTGVRLDLPAHVAGLHSERFSAPPVVGGRPFDLRLARSGRTLRVPADRTVLDVVREAEPGVAYSCRQGFCGTCRTGVLAGEVEHRDRSLTPAERAGEMAICVSRAAGGTLTLDL
ncbi:PDR/VanB family oxidoreductase [Amycolatopsis suaedae]|uniref:Oxidoreductase n=1 Tax=Amycolatopsis suaedae TaxID=2510978 RepID=A0A4Q7IZT6_9PSEU|nr:PDR/VanB family oxidoreductase [Amycolatopsis suaedae]RZQ60571.1 oxidoreductase [Amycolatopsis suaedae]